MTMADTAAAHSPVPASGRGRPRDPSLTDRVLSAALTEYARTGWAAFTFDGVARQAAVGKAALYRRWPTKEHLLADAIESHTRPIVTPDTGSLRGDAQAVATALLRHYLDPAGWATLRIVVDAATGPISFGPFRERIVAIHQTGADRMIERAIARGELSPGVPAKEMIEALFGAVLVHTIRLTADQRADATAHPAEHAAPIVSFVLSLGAA
jgi:AcrR family transcriptional regulator